MMKRLVALLAIAPLIASCKADPVIAPQSLVPDTYRTVLMIYPGPTDGPDSVHLRGGYISLALAANNTADCHIHFVNIDGAASDATYSGTWRQTADTVRLNLGSESLLSNETWLFSDGQLRNVQKPRRGPLEITFSNLILRPD